MSETPKKAINLRISIEEYAWVLSSAKTREISMTEVIRDLIRKQKNRELRKPQQY